MDNSFFNSPTRSGTAGGLLTVLLINIAGKDVLKTIVLAAIGATVSFLISHGWKLLLKRWKRP
ncbi:hypothetical protein [Ferruginibacter sp. HRS2-29]|uniref:hypothetical protein n=1 Tax=Ferruginibacter sp. HRS2-29 TaxID=2487334 RepID=UPI0020CF3C58|nr:hypothetical protein [Ferruginibacter sp. HRS2-29]MCP9749480.1 hypothetical protein [Ferruginibacter sp. HRS2-29]